MNSAARRFKLSPRLFETNARSHAPKGSPRIACGYGINSPHSTYQSSRLFVNRSVLMLQGHSSSAAYSTQQSAETVEEAPPAAVDAEEKADFHTIINDKEIAEGPSKKHEFQAETRMLLDIVAKSLYSEKEVFIRELISNANDALEKLRYFQMTGIVGADGQPVTSDGVIEIHIATDQLARTFTIQDTGIGLTEAELIANLGTIARSGSKAFLQELSEKGKAGTATESIIGQFGVGFYSAFMVADKVEVFTKSHKPGSKGLHWISDGSGSYEIREAQNVSIGTKIVVHLKSSEAVDYADDQVVGDVIKKYSNFVSAPIYLNGKRTNSIQALWTLDPKSITPDMHDEFYRFISHNSMDRPRYCLHYKTDAPISIRALLYVPELKPSLFDMAQNAETGVALYSRKVLIQHKTTDIFPKWMRFVKGVVDSEDIPLNLSRELLQKSPDIAKMKSVVVGRFIKFLTDQMKKDREKYEGFSGEYGLFLKEGIMTETSQIDKEDLAKLLLFESSSQVAGKKVSLMEYASRMQAGQRDIFYICAPSRELAESSPYYEAVKEKSMEVLFAYEPYDEIMLIQLQQFDRKNLTSVEKQLHQDTKQKSQEIDDDIISKADAESLKEFTKEVLGAKVNEVSLTNKTSRYPGMITVEDMGAARYFVKTQFSQLDDNQRYLLLRPRLELNPAHALVKLAIKFRNEDNVQLSNLIIEQIFDNAMITAGLTEDPRPMVSKLNGFLTQLAEAVQK